VNIPYIIFIILAFVIVLYIMHEIVHKMAVEKLRNRIEVNPSYWVWGIFYFNPSDQRIFVPKRIEWLGWTLNFARPGSVILVIGFIAFVIIIKAVS
jgi:uncharacterized membrane protein